MLSYQQNLHVLRGWRCTDRDEALSCELVSNFKHVHVCVASQKNAINLYHVDLNI
jgi:hypothetical protein